MNIEHEDNDRNDCVAAMTREPNNNSNIRSNDHNNNTAALSRLRYGSHYLSSYFACCCPSLNNISSSSRSNSSKTTPTRDVATTSQQRSSSNSSNASSSLVFSRLLFMLCLSLVAIVLGYLVHRFLTEAEIDLAQEQFASIADRAVNEAAEIGRRNKWTMGTMAELAGQMQPNPDEWPFVYISGYEEIGTKLIQTVSEGEVLALAPFVEPEQLQEWENFAYDYFDNVAKFPNGTGINPEWGKGVWKTDRTRETDGFANGSKYQVIFPTFQSQIGPDPVLMFNLRSGEDRRAAIDPIIDCSLKRMNSSDPVPGYKCASMTDMVAIVRYETRGPAAVLYEPIYPANGGGLQLKGLIATLLQLDETLDNVFSTKVEGVDCVIKSKDSAFTYTVKNGVAVVKGEGDLHDPAYDHFERGTTLTDPDYYTEDSQIYTLHIYPSSEFEEAYRTENAKIATIVTVMSIVITTLFFFAFDCCVRKEFKAKKDLLEAKRRFMRFVSHEVRTPLNSVCMGLTVIELELQSLLPLSKEKTQMSAVSNDESNEKQSERLQQLNNLASILPPGALTEGKLANGDACMRSNANIETNTEGKILDCVQLAHEIQSQANSAVDVLNDLLNYDKIENGTLCVEFAFAPVWNLIQRVLKEFTLPAVKKSLKLELMFEVVDKDGKFCAGSDIEQGKSIRSAQDLPAKAQDLVFYADIIRITQSIRNLMSNAIKFTSEGGSVRVRAVWMENSGATSGIKAAEVSPIGQNQKVYAKNKGSLLVNVEDSGVGMDPVQLAGLFRPGVQYDATNLQAGGGSGLGLYIAKGIVEEHKGTLVVTSGGLGQGTTFTISLPVFSVADLRQKCDKRKPTNASISDSIETSSSKLTLLKVLVVDDADSNRKLLSRLLRREGHTCDEADNGQLAVEMVADSMQEGEAPYDTILLDYEMPLMNGPETASEIRRKGWRVFIVGITGNTFTEDVEHFRSCGADAVLPKPVKLDDLRSIWQGHGLLRG